MKVRYAVLSALLLISGCAAPSQPYLDSARAGCSAGDQNACSEIPTLQSHVNAEHQQQANQVAAGLLIGLSAAAVGAAAAYGASHPVYEPVVVVCHPWWAC